MACNADFVQYVIDQCAGAGEIAVRKMMGDYCLYCNGVLFGLLCDNNLYVKVTEAGEAVLEEVELRQPYEGAKDYFFVRNVDDRDYLEDIIKATLPELLSPAARSRKQARKNRQVPVSLDEAIAPDVVCSQDLRAFFQKHLGADFRFRVEFQDWFHRHAGFTYRDAVEAYNQLALDRRPRWEKDSVI